MALPSAVISDEVGMIMRVLFADLAPSGGLGGVVIEPGRSYRGEEGSWKGIAVSEMGSEKNMAEVPVESPYNGLDEEEACNGACTSIYLALVFNTATRFVK